MSEERRQDVMFTSKARDRVKVTREWSGHGKTRPKRGCRRLNARLQGRRGRNGSTPKQDFEADTSAMYGSLTG